VAPCAQRSSSPKAAASASLSKGDCASTESGVGVHIHTGTVRGVVLRVVVCGVVLVVCLCVAFFSF